MLSGLSKIIISVGLIAPLGLLGCADEDKACPTPNGTYQASYAFLNGTCPPIPMHPIPVDGGKRGVNQIIQKRSNDSVITDVVLKGCEVGMTYTVRDSETGNDLSIVQGDMDVVSKTKLTGEMQRQEYDKQTGVMMCSGTFTATFVKMGSGVTTTGI